MSIRNFDFFEVFMKKIWISLISALYSGFTLGYMHFADPRTNAGALSTIGLDHPVLFALWGAVTYGVLYLLLYTMYNKQKRRGLCHGLLLLNIAIYQKEKVTAYAA